MSRACCGLAAAALLLSACATPPVALQDIQFELAGRLAARYRNEAFTGNLSWIPYLITVAFLSVITGLVVWRVVKRKGPGL